jgi:2,4-dienoyl-CoA reductase-like NADH-dependent reductase (Old Yellow Enzyme family)/thioredoxin reductase
MAYEHVLSPLRLRGVSLKNRIVRAAHGTLIGALEPGGIGSAFIAYHEARAKGGVGLSILEICSVHRSCVAPLQVFNPQLPEGYRRLIDAVKPHGMALMQQLWHAGHSGRTLDGSPPWAPSDIPSPLLGIVPTPMTKGMIDEVIGGYAQGARIARECGLDGVEIHAAHTYLLQQFLSPVLNRREDEYGGTAENRMRLLIEVLRAVRHELGNDLILSIRLSPDGLAAGMTVEENRRVLNAVERAGLIDFVNLSSGSYFAMPAMIAPMSEPVGYQLESDAAITADSKLPRLVTGRFRTLEEADQVIRLGQAEMVSMVRATIADPNLVRKTLEGSVEDVRPCIACNQACVGNINRGGLSGLIAMGCAVNPTTGKEASLRDDEVERATSPRNVLVVGGGPAGMEAARLAALRGHRVTLVEASPNLGGQINLARRAPYRHTIGDITHWMERQVYQLGVDVRLGTYFEADDVVAYGADGIVLATGSRPRMDGVSLLDPSVPTSGIEQVHVWSSHDLMSSQTRRVHGTAVVSDDVGHYEAIAVAETLLDRGAEEVIFVTRLHSLAPQLDPAFTAEPAKKRLFGTGRFRVLPNSAITRIGEDEVEISLFLGSRRERVRAAIVVLVSFNRCNNEIYEAIRDRHPDVQLVGDALSPRYLEEAIRNGNLAGRMTASGPQLAADAPSPTL